MVRKRKNSMCILCYKHTTTSSNSSVSEHYKFLSLLSKHVKVSQLKGKLLQQTKTELLCCKVCAKLGASFCEFYNNRSEVESGRVLQLAWKVRQVYERMTYAGRVLSRFFKFRKQFVGSVDSQQVCRNVQELRKELMMRCKKVVKSNLPKVYLKRISEQDKNAAVSAKAPDVKIEVEQPPEAEECPPLFLDQPASSSLQVKVEVTSSQSVNEDHSSDRNSPNAEERSVPRNKSLGASNSQKSSTNPCNLTVKNEVAIDEDVGDTDDKIDSEFNLSQDSEDNDSVSDYELRSESSDDDYEPVRKKRAAPVKAKKSTSAAKKEVAKSPTTTSFQCSICSKFYGKKSRFRRHMMNVHNKPSGIEGTFQCGTCEEWFSSQYDLRCHIKFHKRKVAEANTPSKCSDCLKEFPSKDKLNSHIQSVHKRKEQTPHKIILNPNQCECEKVFSCEAEVEKHRVLDHKLERFVRCHVCQKLCQCYSALVAHRTRRTRIPCYTPNLEDLQLPAAAPLFPYQKMIFGNKFCPVEGCYEVFEHQEVLETHLKAHGTWKCAKCPEVFSKAHEFAWHELISHNPKLGESDPVKKTSFSKKGHVEKCDFLCSRCDLAFVRKGGVIAHFVHIHLDIPKPNIFCKPTSYKYKSKIRPVHLKNEQSKPQLKTSSGGFKCQYCKKEFKIRVSLSIHLKNMHKGLPSGLPGALECDICHERFDYEHSLNKHKNSHVDDDKTECKACGRKFKNNLYLTRHIAYRHEQPKKQWPCETCGQLFKSKQQVGQHVSLKHTDSSEWKFVCPEEGCGRRCFSKQRLTLHLRTHTKERPFICHICGESYRYQQSLKTHMAKAHGDLEEKAVANSATDDAV